MPHPRMHRHDPDDERDARPPRSTLHLLRPMPRRITRPARVRTCLHRPRPRLRMATTTTQRPARPPPAPPTASKPTAGPEHHHENGVGSRHQRADGTREHIVPMRCPGPVPTELVVPPRHRRRRRRDCRARRRIFEGEAEVAAWIERAGCGSPRSSVGWPGASCRGPSSPPGRGGCRDVGRAGKGAVEGSVRRSCRALPAGSSPQGWCRSAGAVSPNVASCRLPVRSVRRRASARADRVSRLTRSNDAGSGTGLLLAGHARLVRPAGPQPSPDRHCDRRIEQFHGVGYRVTLDRVA